MYLEQFGEEGMMNLCPDEINDLSMMKPCRDLYLKYGEKQIIRIGETPQHNEQLLF